jgi:glycine/D-amino acid oxidase-like deaminating enzyme
MSQQPPDFRRREQAISNQVTTFIIGAGVFGLSLLRYISSTRPTDKVTAFDSCENGSAMNDTHKIVRTQYTSKRRTEISKKSQEGWAADPVLSPFYHLIGRIEITDDTAKLDAIDAISTRRERLTEQSIDQYLKTCGQLSREYCCLEFAAKVLKTAKDPTLHCLWNPDNAVIDWNLCMQEIRKPLQSKIREARVEKLIVGDAGRICGLQLDGREIVTLNDGDKIIITAGAWGEWLLKESNIAAPPKHSQAVGVFTFHLKPNSLQREYLKHMPAFSFQTKGINCMFPSHINARLLTL